MTLLFALGGRHARLQLHVLGGTLDAPAEGVDAGVHDEADGAHHLHAQAAEELVGCSVHPHLLSQPLAIQGPSLQVGCVERPSGGPKLVAAVLNVAQKIRELGVLECQRALQVVARDAFMKSQRGHLVAWTLAQARDVHVEAARACPIWRSGKIVRNRTGRFLHDLQLHDRQLEEIPRERLGDLVDKSLVTFHECVLGVVEVRLVSLEAVGKLREGALEAQNIEHLLLEAALDARDLLQAHVVDFLCTLLGRRVEAQALCINLGAVAHGGDAWLRPGTIQVQLRDEVVQLVQAATETIVDSLLDMLGHVGVHLLALERGSQLVQVALDQALESRWDLSEHGLGRRGAAHARPVGQQVAEAIDLCWERHQSVEINLEIVVVLKAHPLEELQEVLVHAPHADAVERRQMAANIDASGLALGGVEQQLHVEPFCGREAFRAPRANSVCGRDKLLEGNFHLGVVLLSRLEGARSELLELRVVLVEASLSGKLRIVLQLPFEVNLEQSLELLRQASLREIRDRALRLSFNGLVELDGAATIHGGQWEGLNKTTN
mmetsp:Transcript_66945/g.173278  ORF Transcript_66945/g.173278 Transcript_66945/m.173278 type:complete len:549 (-) Transcript_66945:15-1661(-)